MRALILSCSNCCIHQNFLLSVNSVHSINYLTFHLNLLLSALYKPVDGLIHMKWYESFVYSISDLERKPTYPSCPSSIENKDNFEYQHSAFATTEQSRFITYFVAKNDGSHMFFIICGGICTFSIESRPSGYKEWIRNPTHQIRYEFLGNLLQFLD